MSREEAGPYPSRIELLELDIDSRMVDLWRELGLLAARNGDSFSLDEVAAFLRAAYGKAYCDALLENPQERGALCNEHGYRVPRPRPFPLYELLRDK